MGATDVGRGSAARASRTPSGHPSDALRVLHLPFALHSSERDCSSYHALPRVQDAVCDAQLVERNPVRAPKHTDELQEGQAARC